MIKTYKNIISSLLVAGSLAACSPEEFGGVNELGIPQATEYADMVSITVDQSINQATFKVGAKEVYGVWTIDTGKKQIKKVGSEFAQIFTNSGDYTVTVQLGNKNGVSDGSITKTFHIDNSIVDFTKYTTILSKADWHMANKEKGHLACGESGSDGTNWWSGDPDCKANEGVYDNVLTFTSDFKYTFNPGDHGTIYVNKGVTIWPDYRDENNDYNVPVELQNAEYGLEVDGDDLYLTFPKGTYFPYIANDYIWNTPRYKVVNMTPKKMTLLIDEPGVIAWQYILTTENTVEKAFTGFTYDQADNIWKNIEVNAGGIYYADANWSPYADNGGATFDVTNQETKVVLPLATASQWQAQFPIVTNVGPGSANMVSTKNYDFSCVITSNKDLKGMTLKLVETGDNGVPGSLGIAYDANAVFYNNETNLKAYEDYVFYLVDQPGVDIQDNLLQLVMDFGGCEEGTEVTIKNIVLIDHALNKELDKLPAAGGDDDPNAGPVVDWTGANLLAGMPVNITQYYAPGWSQLADAEYTAENGVYTITYPSATTDQWQAQFTFNNTGIALDPEKSYDFRVKLTSTTDHPGVTVKLTQQDNDDIFLTQDRHKLVAFEETWIELADMKVNKESITDLKIPFDFGGVAEGTVITISDMHLQEHKEKAGGNGGGTNWNGTNLLASMSVDLSQYYAPGWSQLADAEYTSENGNYVISYPTATSDQWQAQFTFNRTGISLDPAKAYDFRVKLMSTTDHPGATVKVTQQDNDDIYLTADRHALTAYEDLWIELPNLMLNKEGQITDLKIVFDFGGNAANTEITISDMHLQEHAEGGNGGGSTSLDYNSTSNLWKAVDEGSAFVSVTPWFSPEGWGGGLTPEWSHDAGSDTWELTIPEGMGGSQWMGQFPINTTISAEQAATYSFAVTLYAENDCPGVTIKLTQTDEDGAKHDDNFFFADRHDVPGYEDWTYTAEHVQLPKGDAHALSLFFDFGGSPVNTKVQIKKVTLIKD